MLSKIRNIGGLLATMLPGVSGASIWAEHLGEQPWRNGNVRLQDVRDWFDLEIPGLPQDIWDDALEKVGAESYTSYISPKPAFADLIHGVEERFFDKLDALQHFVDEKCGENNGYVGADAIQGWLDDHLPGLRVPAAALKRDLYTDLFTADEFARTILGPLKVEFKGKTGKLNLFVAEKQRDYSCEAPKEVADRHGDHHCDNDTEDDDDPARQVAKIFLNRGSGVLIHMLQLAGPLEQFFEDSPFKTVVALAMAIGEKETERSATGDATSKFGMTPEILIF